MKVKRIPWLAVLSVVFAAFIVGFFIGRNLDRTPVQIRSLPSAAPAAVSDRDAAEPSGEAATDPTEPIGLININTASLPMLQTLPGIGPELAKRIIDYRQTHGPFESVGALIHVNGIGEKKLEALWDLVTTVEGVS